MRGALTVLLLGLAFAGALAGLAPHPSAATSAPPSGGVAGTFTASNQAAYEIAVLPGLEATTPTDIRMTSGWHSGKGAIDTALVGLPNITRGQAVHAAFRVIRNPTLVAKPGVTFPQVRARVAEVIAPDPQKPLCGMVDVVILERASATAPEREIGAVRYLHVVPSVEYGMTFSLSSGMQTFPIGTVVAYDKDGWDCTTTGDHLHTEAEEGRDSGLWRNIGRAWRADDGLGFDPEELGYASGLPGPRFCSDTRLFTIYPPVPAGETAATWAPAATNVAQCTAPAAPTGLQATPGIGQITLHWDNPNDATITGYQVRRRATAPTAGAWSAWTAIDGSGPTTTQHSLSGLTSGRTYAVQVRATAYDKTATYDESGGWIRLDGPPARGTDTPTAPPTPTYPVTVQQAGTGSGTVVPNGGTYAKGSSPSFVATAASGSSFTSWRDCDSDAGATCQLTNLTAARTITVTFTKTSTPPPDPPASCEKATKPEATRDKPVTQTKTELGGVADNAQRQRSRTGTQPQTRSVTCKDDAWVTGAWEDDGEPTWDAWPPDGGWGAWVCRTVPPQPPDDQRTITIATTYSWRVSGDTAYQQKTLTKRDDTRPHVWVGPEIPTCAWQDGSWVEGTPYPEGPTDTGVKKVRPPADTVPVKVPGTDRTETRWRTEATGTFCIQYQEQRHGARYSYYSRPHVWSSAAEEWVDGPRNPFPYYTDPATVWGAWTETGATRLCPAASGQTAPAAQLPAGAYVWHWGAQRFQFTVPAGAVVQLQERPLPDGGVAAVFTAADGTELVVDPATLPAADAPASDQFRAVGEPTLAALAATLRQAPPPAKTAVTDTERECAVAAADAQGAVVIALAAPGCTVVPGGGQVTVRHGAETRTFPLDAAYDWLVLAGGGVTATETPAVTFVTIPQGGALTLALGDGAELARQVPAAHPALAAVFDALASPPPDPGE